MTIEIKKQDGLEFLNSLPKNSVDLILTDPPYMISTQTNMNKFRDKVIAKNGENMKTEKDWEKYKLERGYVDDRYKKRWIKYGNSAGKKFAYRTMFGCWDNNFIIEKLEKYIKLFYKKLRTGGTAIIFFDLWKIETLRNIMEKNHFKQIRLIEWIKSNPLPLNQSRNYLSNSREIAVLGVKNKNPTFNSKFDRGLYWFPSQGGKTRFHPTQKSLKLFEALVRKHSNKGDLVVDCFLGGGTTAQACKNLGRSFKGCEINEEYFSKIKIT